MKKNKGFTREVSNYNATASLSFSSFSEVYLRRRNKSHKIEKTAGGGYGSSGKRKPIPDPRNFVHQAASVLLALGLILCLLPGRAAAQGDGMEARAAWVVSQYDGRNIPGHPYSGTAACLGRLANNPNDAAALTWISTTFPTSDHPDKTTSFTYPFMGWILNKYRSSFSQAQLDNLLSYMKDFDHFIPGQDTENHMINFLVGHYLILQAFPGEDGWRSSRSDPNLRQTRAEGMALDRDRILSILRNLYSKGNEEFLSNAYTAVFLSALYALHACAEDAELKSAAEAALVYVTANMAANAFDGITIPAFNRKNSEYTNLGDRAITNTQSIHWLYWAEATNLPKTSTGINNLTENNSLLARMLAAALCEWRPPIALYALASGEVTPYTLRSSMLGHRRLDNLEGGEPAAQVRYVYRHPLFGMGSSYQEHFLTFPNYWTIIFSGSMFGIVYKSSKSWNTIEAGHCYWNTSPNGKLHRSYSSPCTQIAQHEGTSIMLLNIPQADPFYERGLPKWITIRDVTKDDLIKEGWLRYPKSIDQQVEAGGWIFLREGDVYIAIRPLSSYTIDTNVNMDGSGGTNFNLVRTDPQPAPARTGFVFDIATKEEFATFEAFQTAISQTPLSVNLTIPSVTYTNVKGVTLTATWNPPEYGANRVLVRANITVNGEEVVEDSDFPNALAVVKSPVFSIEGRILKVNTPAGSLLVDWRGDYPIIGRHYYNARIAFTDSVSGKPVEGLEVILHGSKYITDAQGMISIPEILGGTYNLAVTDSRLVFTENPAIEIQSDSLYHIRMKRIPRLSLQVINRTAGDPVSRAFVIVGKETYPTDASGFVNIILSSPGTYIASVEHRDYFPVSDTLFVPGDTTIHLSLTPKRANVTFSFSDINGPVSGVKVTLSGSQYTNSSGDAFFFSQPAREKHSWSAEKTGYYALRDSFHLETDTTLQVTMELGTMVQKKSGDTHFIVYPIPAHDYLVIDKEIPVANPVKIDLVNVSGISVFSAQDIALPYTLRLKRINPGIYLLKITFPEGFSNQVITVK